MSKNSKRRCQQKPLVSSENERGAVLHRFSNPISLVKSCLHCEHFAFLYNPKLFNKVTISNIKQCQNMKHLYTNNPAEPKLYFTFAGFKIFLLFSLLYEKCWVIRTSISLVRFWVTYLNVLPKMSILHDSVSSRTMLYSSVFISTVAGGSNLFESDRSIFF